MAKDKILIVEDERIIAEDLEQSLTRLGYEITGIASSSKVALEMADANLPDLAIMDIRLQGKTDGITVAEKLNSRYDIPSIYLTAYADKSILKRAKITTPYGYILKPFDDRELHINVEIALERSRTDRMLRRANSVLKTVNDIDQLIVRERDHQVLIKQACKILIREKVYPRSWIVLLDKEGKLTHSAQSGWGKKFQLLQKMVKKGDIPACGLKAINSDDIIFTIGSRNCRNCPFKGLYPSYSNMTVGLKSHGKNFGLFSLAVPERVEINQSEIDLFQEVAGGISFSLYNMDLEESLRKSEKLYRTLSESSQDSIYIIGKDDRVEFVNTFGAAQFRKQPSDIIGKPLASLFPGEIGKEQFGDFKKVFRSGEALTNEKTAQFGNRKVSLHNMLIPLKDEKGKVSSVMGISRDITEQKQVQKKLKAAQEFSRNIIDSSLNMIITVDRHRHITEFNPAAEHTFGYTREEILGKHINILYAKLEQGRQVHRKTMESGQHVQDVLNKRKNGKVFPAVLASSTLVTSQGKLVGVMGISRDISEQTIALDRLKESEEQFRSMTNTATDAIIGMDEKGTIQVWNPAAAQLFGYTEKEALEKNLHDLIVPTYYRKQARSALKEFYKTGKGRMLGKTIELTGLKKNGKEFPVELSISSYKRQGKWQATGIIRDITERKEADDLLKLSETKFRTLFEKSNDTIYITSLDGKIIDMNPAGEELFRYTREELLKMKAQELYVFPEERKVFQQTMREKGSARNYELRLKRKDGVLRNCLVSASPWKDNTGKLIGYQGIIHDVTEELLVQNELKEALLKAQEADRVKSLFLANMSHEIRTPLNTVLGFTELVEHTVKDQIPAEEQGFFKTIRTSGKRLSHTIHEILNISQIEAGTFQTHLKEHNLVEMLEIAIMPLKSQAAEKGLEFTSRSTIAEAPVYVDEYCVIQAISNVVENAIKYTPKGKVEVILNGARNTFNVRVTDTGEGIAKKNLNDIFKEFKQESEGYTKKYQGVGLGLALVKRYLEICRADIEVKSEKGAGSTFILKFPKWRGKKHKGG